jgi:thiol-disulfide isomerase/thioredoxin
MIKAKVVCMLSLILTLLVGFSSRRAETARMSRPLALTDPAAIQAQDPAPTPKELPDSVLNAELKSTKGGPFKLSDYKGNLLVIGLWGTWCAPCRFQIRDLVPLQREFGSKGVTIIALSTEDPVASAASVRHWIRTYKLNYRVGWAPTDFSNSLMQDKPAIPQVFLIRDGRIVKRFIGFNRDQTPLAIKQAIEVVLKGQ